jgi:hypothetical protein
VSGDTGTGDATPERLVILAGAQRFEPTVGEALARFGIEGPIATITAGWQERESEDEELHAHLGERTTNLSLHARAEALFAADPVVRDAHRKKQQRLRHKQDFYRIRLEHELDANHVIRQRRAPPEILAEEERASLFAIRTLDQYHLSQCAQIHRAFDDEVDLLTRPSLKQHRDELAEILRGVSALAIAGGHVATLLYRLHLFGIKSLLGALPVIAWSAGAMAICERVVLFHDDPPQGPGASEVLDAGLGLVRGVVALPHPETRLRLDNEERVGVLARRFAPAHCLALPARAYVRIEADAPSVSRGVRVLQSDGHVRALGERLSVRVEAP